MPYIPGTDVNVEDAQMLSDEQVLSLRGLRPEHWTPMVYSVTADIPVTAGGLVRCSIQTNNQPFILTKITHGIVGNVGDPTTSGLYDDGQYTVDWRDEIRTYVKEPVVASLLWGPKIQGEWPKLPFAIFYFYQHTLTFTLQNVYARTLTPSSDTYQVQIACHGIMNSAMSPPPPLRR